MTVYNVSNSTQLNAALGRAAGGDTILLAGGDYGSAVISNKNFGTAVTIKSASSTFKAHFDYVQVSGSRNISLQALDVGHARAPGETDNTQMMRVQSSNGIQMAGLSIHGSLDNNPANDGLGLMVTGSSNVQLLGSSFRELSHGAFFDRNSNVTIASNSFQTIRSDGIDFGRINNVVVDKNSFTDFHPIRGDHADAIQFWLVNATAGSSNITITNNTIMQGSGLGTQGIFLSDPSRYSYSNVLIQNNLIYGNDMYHGIYVNGGRGVQILGNSTLSNGTDAKQLWIDLQAGTGFTVKDNATDNILVQHGATGVTLSHNLNLAHDPAARGMFPNLSAPTAAKDLIIAGYGYHVANTTASAASTGTIHSSPHTATGTQVSQTAIADATTPNGTAHLAPADYPPSHYSGPTFYDHFVPLA